MHLAKTLLNVLSLNNIQASASLYNGVTMPLLGLGVWRASEGHEVREAVSIAFENGYRHIDTAAMYGNEAGVGAAVRESGLDRKGIFVTTKVWNSDQGYDATLRAFEKSNQLLKLDFVDLYLVHWPVKGLYKETWKALEYLYDQGAVRAIGVSNFMLHHLNDLLPEVDIKPMVNQVEHHPYLVQQDLQDFCKSEKIQMEAWSPLMQGGVMQVPELIKIGKKYGKSAAQVVLRWNLQNGIVTIPKSTNPKRIQENADIFDFALSQEDMSVINGLDKSKRVGPDPDVFC